MKLLLRRVAPFATIALILGLTTLAIASPPSGQTVSPATVGTLDRTERIKTDGVKFRTKVPTEVATLTITLAPGGFTGWHTHPGILFATVKSGAVVREVGCDARRYETGETFIEHGAQPTGQVRNASTTAPAEFVVTQIAPKGVARRVESDPPNCNP
jgi:quercetin dioxygenase-like cupin family protein